MMDDRLVLSFVIPCPKEAPVLASNVTECHHGVGAVDFRYEVIVADNGSSDGSIATARHEGARLVSVPQRGYGAALQTDIAVAHAEFALMGDADLTSCFDRAARKGSSSARHPFGFMQRNSWCDTSLRTAPEVLLRLIRQCWCLDNEWPLVPIPFAARMPAGYVNRTGTAVFLFLRTVLMSLLRRGGYRSSR